MYLSLLLFIINYGGIVGQLRKTTTLIEFYADVSKNLFFHPQGSIHNVVCVYNTGVFYETRSHNYFK